MLRKLIAALCLSALLACPADALTGTRRVLLSGNPFLWVLTGAVMDMDFANGRYFGGTLTSLLSVSRASNATDLLPSSPSGYVYNTYAPNVLAVSPGKGLLIFEARTNQLLNSAAPATQTTGALAATPQTLWVNGQGSAVLSNGTATGCAGTATNGLPVTFTPTAGTCTVTVIGSLNFEQLEPGAFGTSGIVTAGATATRQADNVTGTSTLRAAMNNQQGTLYIKGKTKPDGNVAGFISLNDGTSNNRIDLRSTQLALVRSLMTVAGSQVSDLQQGAISGNTAVTMALSWQVGASALGINGASVATATPASLPASTNTLNIGNLDGAGNPLDNSIARIAFFASARNPAAVQALSGQ
jgi:hypothetical protein